MNKLLSYLNESRRKITKDELEDFCIRGFQKMNEYKAEITSLNDLLKDTRDDLKNIEPRYLELKKEFNKRNLINIGKGEYYNICKRPIEIKEKLSNLEYSVYNNYTGEVDPKKLQEYTLLKETLKEDLEIAEREYKKFKVETRIIEDHYFNISNKRNKYIKLIRLIKFKIFVLEQMQNKKLKEIKHLEKAYKNEKNVLVKKYNIK